MFCPNKQRSFESLRCLDPFQTRLESNCFGTAVSNYTLFHPSSEEQVGRVDRSFGSSPDVRAWCRGFEYVSVSPWLLRTVLGYSQPTSEDTKHQLKKSVRMTNKQTNKQASNREMSNTSIDQTNEYDRASYLYSSHVSLH